MNMESTGNPARSQYFWSKNGGAISRTCFSDGVVFWRIYTLDTTHRTAKPEGRRGEVTLARLTVPAWT